MDPVLCVAAAIGIFWAVRNRAVGLGTPVTAWLAVCCLALFGYSYRNVTYLLPLIPALALAAAICVPRRGAAALAAVAAVRAALFVSQPAEPDPVFKTVEFYCSERRVNETVVVSPRDQFYTTLLPLRNVRYAFAEAEFPPQGFAVDFRKMGIVVTVDEFLDLQSRIANYKEQLKQWGVHTTTPIATVVLYRDEAELERLMRERSDADFIVPHASSVLIRYGPPFDETLAEAPCRM
jgi:hypothetical protein